MKKILVFCILLLSLSSQAQDRLFTYTYQSNVLNKGQKELEVWTTMRTGRDNFYRAFDNSLEFEVGLGGNLQTSFYLNNGYSKGIETTNNIRTVVSGSSYSFANEWKLKLSDPVANKFGSAFYFEYALAPEETALEGKMIFDKQTGRIIHALNLVGELELGKKFETVGNIIKPENEKEYKLELNYGLSCKISEQWYAGIELMNENVFAENELEWEIAAGLRSWC